MYSDFRSFNPEGERLLVLTLAGKLTRESQDCADQAQPGFLHRIVDGMRPAPSRKPVTAVEASAPCDDLSGAMPATR